MPNETITIKFKPEGDRELIQAINSLAKAQMQLGGKAKILTKEQGKSTITTQRTTGAMHKLSIKLKSLGSDFQKAGISAGLHSKALKGDEVALEKVKMAVNKHTRALQRNRKTMMGTVHDTRILGGSFAVLRSKLLIASFAIAMFEKAIMNLVRAYADQEQAELRVKNAIRATGMAAGMTFKEIKKLATELQKNGVIGDEVNLKMASLMLTYDKIGSTVFPRAMKAMNDMAVAQSMGIPAAEELKTVTTMLAKALQEPVKGLNALRRVGFSLSEQQRQQVEEFVAVGKVAKAQNIILAAAERQYGDLAQVIKDSAIGATAQLSNAWGDAKESIGEVLSEVILPMVKALKEFAETITPERVKAYGSVISGILVVAMGAYVNKLKQAVIWQTRLGWGAVATAVGFVASEMLILSGIFDNTSDNMEDAKLEVLSYTQSLLKMGRADLAEQLEEQNRRIQEATIDVIDISKIMQQVSDIEDVYGDMNLFSEEKQNKTIKDFNNIIELLNKATGKGLIDIEGVIDNAGKIDFDSIKEKLIELADATSVLTDEEAISNAQEMIDQIKYYLEILDAGFEIMDDFSNAQEQANQLYKKTPESQKEAIASNIQMIEGLIRAAETTDKNADALERYRIILAMLKNDLLKFEDSPLAKALEIPQEQIDKINLFLSKTLGGISSAVQGFAGAEKTKADSAKADELRAAENIKNERRRQSEIDRINDKYDKKAEGRKKKYQKWMIATAVAQGASAILNVWSEKSMLPQPWSTISRVALTAGVIGTTTQQIQTIKAQKFAQGGLIGGRLHAQGGTPIEAERGEYVMSRRAVDAIGVETMNKINQGNAVGNVNIQFTGNVMSQDFIEDEAIPMIKEAVRRGADIGVA